MTGRITWWIHSHRRISTKTSSVTSSGCTTDICSEWSASAWKTKAAARATPPNSHGGLVNR